MRGGWTTNLLLKVLALLLAVFLWNLYRSDPQSVRSLTVPLEFANLPPDRELAGDIPASITVQVEAPEPIARTLTADWIDAKVDLAGAPPGERRLPIGLEILRVPAGAQVLSVSPDVITLRIEAKVRKSVPVETRVRGDAGDGFRVGRVTVTPTRATVEGPESEVARAQKVITEWVSAAGREVTFQEGVSLLPDNGRVRLVGPRSAIATVEIVPVAPEKP